MTEKHGKIRDDDGRFYLIPIELADEYDREFEKMDDLACEVYTETKKEEYESMVIEFENKYGKFHHDDIFSLKVILPSE